jgi:hypothetical protein
VLSVNLNNAAFKVLPIDSPTARRPIAAITLRNRTLSPVAQLLIHPQALDRQNEMNHPPPPGPVEG